MRSWRRIDGHDRSWEPFDPFMTIVAQFHGKSAPIAGRSGHDRVTIGP